MTPKVDFVMGQCRFILGKKKYHSAILVRDGAHGPGCGGRVVRGCDVWEQSIWEFYFPLFRCKFKTALLKKVLLFKNYEHTHIQNVSGIFLRKSQLWSSY